MFRELKYFFFIFKQMMFKRIFDVSICNVI